MSLIKKGTQLKQDIKLKGLIYGTPGTGKTTLALSAPKPLLFDFDKGFHRAHDITIDNDVVEIIAGYETILRGLKEEDLSNYSTIVIDTFGRLIESIQDWIIKNDPRMKSNKIQMYGKVKEEFVNFLKVLQEKDKSVVFVAHEKEDKSGDITVKRIDVVGSSGNELMKYLDFVGYVSTNGNKRTVDFMPNDLFYAKNSIGLENFIEIDDLNKTGKNNFLEERIFKAYKEKNQKNAELIKEYDDLIETISASISDISDLDGLNGYYSKFYNKREKIWSSHQVEAALLKAKVEELGFEFDAKAKEFKVKETKKEGK